MTYKSQQIKKMTANNLSALTVSLFQKTMVPAYFLAVLSMISLQRLSQVAFRVLSYAEDLMRGL